MSNPIAFGGFGHGAAPNNGLSPTNALYAELASRPPVGSSTSHPTPRKPQPKPYLNQERSRNAYRAKMGLPPVPGTADESWPDWAARQVHVGKEYVLRRAVEQRKHGSACMKLAMGEWLPPIFTSQDLLAAFPTAECNNIDAVPGYTLLTENLAIARERSVEAAEVLLTKATQAALQAQGCLEAWFPHARVVDPAEVASPPTDSQAMFGRVFYVTPEEFNDFSDVALNATKTTCVADSIAPSSSGSTGMSATVSVATSHANATDNTASPQAQAAPVVGDHPAPPLGAGAIAGIAVAGLGTLIGAAFGLRKLWQRQSQNGRSALPVTQASLQASSLSAPSSSAPINAMGAIAPINTAGATAVTTVTTIPAQVQHLGADAPPAGHEDDPNWSPPQQTPALSGDTSITMEDFSGSDDEEA